MTASAKINIEVGVSIGDRTPFGLYTLTFNCTAWDNKYDNPTEHDSDCLALLEQERTSLPSWISPDIIDAAEAEAKIEFLRNIDKYAA